MKAKTVLVTGASGFVGRALVVALLQAGYAVRAATRRRVSFPPEAEITIIPNLRNEIDWRPILQGVDIIVHAAGPAHRRIPEEAFSEFDEVNWIATRRLALGAKEANVERFVFISTVRAQSGAAAHRPLREDDEPRPTNHYGRSKLAAEQSIHAAGVPYTIFRPVVIYGPHPKGNMRSLLQLARSPLPLPIANFTSHRSLLGIDNLISAVVFALSTAATIDQTYLLADDAPLTTGEIISILREKHNCLTIPLPIPQAFLRFVLWLCGRSDLWSRLAGNLVVDTSKFAATGWRAPVSTHDGLRRMMQTVDHNEE